MCTWSNLTVINIAQNNLSSAGLSTCLCDLPSLAYLDILQNSIGGPLPACIVATPNITRIDITDNRITGMYLCCV